MNGDGGKARQRTLIVALLVAHIAAESLVAQDSVALHSDARVRLIVIGGDRWVVGGLLTPPSDTVRLLSGHAEDSVAVATVSLARFEISRGRHRQNIRGLWIGTAFGAVAGFGYGLAASEPCGGSCPAPELGQGAKSLLVGVLGGDVRPRHRCADRLAVHGRPMVAGSAAVGERIPEDAAARVRRHPEVEVS